jgi:subtilisin family serine protease
VINVSLNFDPTVDGCAEVPTVCGAIRKANRSGSLVVAAAGNAVTGNGKRKALYPGAAPHALAVAATTEHGCLAAYSHYGKRTDLVAPGGGPPRPAATRPGCAGDDLGILQLTYSCFPMDCAGQYQGFEIRPDVGTSMSAAHVSGVAALVIASGAAGADPGADRLALRLQCTARPKTPHRFYRSGLLDARRAVDPKRDCDRGSGKA